MPCQVPSIIALRLLVAVVVAVALFSALIFPLELTMRSYMELADVLLSGRLLHESFLPVGYAATVALGMKLNAVYGLALIQFGVYVLAVWLVLVFMRERLAGAPAKVFWLVFCLVAFHPYMLINIHRVNDNAINVCLMLVLWVWMRRQQVRGTFDAIECVLAGGALGCFLLSRPNSASLVPVLVLAVFLSGNTLSGRLKSLVALLSATTITYGLLAWLITGSATFWPQNGPYNLYAGNNPFSNATLLAKGNGEESLDLALRAKDLLPPDKPAYDVAPAVLKELAYQHIKAHPTDFLKGIGIKTWVLLGPDLRQAKSLPKVLVQWALACPAVIWVLILMRSAYLGWRSIDWLPVLFIGMYLAPFLVFNADARLRTPLLDVLFLLHAAAMYWDQRRLLAPRMKSGV